MKVTFVHRGRENLGIEYLSSVLKERGHKTSLLLDLGLFGQSDNVFYLPFLEKVFSCKEGIIKEIQKDEAGLITFSTYTDTYPWALQIAKRIRGKVRAKIVFGGIHSTLVPDIVIKNDCIDFVIVGEGEYALLDLVERLEKGEDTTSIDNVWTKKDGKVIQNEVRAPISNLDALPYPDKELFEKEIRFGDDYMVLTTRGCPSNCTYCCESFLNRLYKGKFFRRRSVPSVIAELKFMKSKYNFKEVMFYDSIFFTDKEWLKELLNRFKEEIKVPFKCEGHIWFFDQEIAELLKSAGCYCVNFGIQTMNENVRKKTLARLETNEQIESAFKICDRLNLRYDIDHIFGLPEEGDTDYEFATRFYSQLKYLNRIKCHNLTYFPGIKIVEIAREKGLLNDKDIEAISEGETGDFFHTDSLKSSKERKVKRDFEVLFIILPLLPPSLVKFVLKHKLYRGLRYLPSPLTIFLQILVAIKGKDYRYVIYVRYYLHQFLRWIKRRLLDVLLLRFSMWGRH